MLFSLSITVSYTLLLKMNLIGSPKGRVGRQRNFFMMEPRSAHLIGWGKCQLQVEVTPQFSAAVRGSRRNRERGFRLVERLRKRIDQRERASIFTGASTGPKSEEEGGLRANTVI